MKILPMRKLLKVLTLLACLFCSTDLKAVSDDELLRLEADMLNYIGTNERDTFFAISEQLKKASEEADNERLFYKAWSKQAVFEATHQNYAKAEQIAKELTEYAQKKGSSYGSYFATHTEATILMQKNEYAAAEKAYLKALNIRHQYFPKESAAEDLRELMKLAYLQGDREGARKYANQLLAEPNVAPHHKGRTLYRLSIMAFEDNNVEEYNHIYDEMKRLMQTDGIRLLNLFTEVNYNIINGDYKQALRLADWLSPDTCAERKAIIYHRMGDNEKAYEYMALYKHLFDSITAASHNNTVANLYLRMNNDRLRLEREVLKHQNTQLHTRLYIIGGVIFILILLFLIFKGRRMIKGLKHDNMMLHYGKEDAERAIEDLNELSFYESKSALPLTTPLKPNELGNRLAAAAQEYCHKGVTSVFQTELPDDLEIITNADALKKLLTHLLNYSSRFTYKGTIKLSCTDSGENVRFSITDTSAGLGQKPKDHYVGMFAEHNNSIRYVGMNFNICQSITRLLRGRIWHDADYTSGTRFCVEIPKEP